MHFIFIGCFLFWRRWEYGVKRYYWNDEQGRPNYHGDWVEWTEEEKETNYPLPTQQPTEQEQFNAQLMKEIALLKVGVKWWIKK